jgi:hypothetical protein
MRVEFLQTVLSHLGNSRLALSSDRQGSRTDSQVLCASCNFTTFLEAMTRVATFLLAKHEILCRKLLASRNPKRLPKMCQTVEFFAVRSNEECCTLERRTCGAQFLNLGQRTWQRRRILVGVCRRRAIVIGAHRWSAFVDLWSNSVCRLTELHVAALPRCYAQIYSSNV